MRYFLSLLGLFVPAFAALGQTSPAAAPGPFTPEIAEFVKSFKTAGQDLRGEAAPLPAAESLKKITMASGFRLELVASEPVVRQPIDLRFDERGRLWVVQYLQYPFPAGVTITGYDQYIRAEFDRVSPPPPRHFRGADKITILEDGDGDGQFETVKTFLDGLNMATSVLPGDGGVWVMMSPYLLFYPDRDGDDVPDGDPEVHLAGFGLEDTHSLATSLHWGPDGWLYGATGSTTTLDVQGIKLLGQGIWRYHPGTRVFEIFAEGGGNTHSLEFDRFGRAFSGTNFGATRGLHYAQGATYVKNWPKHGPALNPFIFGFLEHMAHMGYSPRFAQAFILYEGGAIPALEGEVVAGMAMTNRVQASRVLRDTSTFRTIDSTLLADSADRTFRPVDVELGPDGAIYIADWTDARMTHVQPADTWDKTNGRIFRIVPENFARPRPVDLRTLKTDELLTVLAHPNRERREQARRLLATRPEPIAAQLRAMLDKNEATALEAFWVLNLRGELAEAQLRAALSHPDAHIRRWAVRLLGDRNSVGATTREALADLAQAEPDVEVRSQLASGAKRLPPGQAFPIIRALLGRDEDAADKHLPLLVWWAIEAQAERGREELLALVRDPAVWQSRMFAQHTAERIGQRFTADQGPRRHYTLKHGVYSEWLIERAPEHLARNLAYCGRLLEAAPDAAAAGRLLAGMARGLTGGVVEPVPAAMRAALARAWAAGGRNAALVALGARLGRSEAMGEAVAAMRRGGLAESDQQTYLDLFSSTGAPEGLPIIADLLRTEKNEARRAKRLAALGGYDTATAADVAMEVFPALPPRLQATAQRMLSEKPAWAQAMLTRLNAGTFKAGVLSSASVAAIRAHNDPRLTSLLTTYQQKNSEDPALRTAQQAFEAGRITYNNACATCHQEAGEGRYALAPALVGSRWLQAGDEVIARIVLHGKESPARGFIMPPWRQFDDAQIAAVLTYVRREFGGQTSAVAPETITAVRAATSAREKAWTDAELDSLPRPDAKATLR
ncbi:MAG: c-type cytochrome [Opitutaceae bacterium]|nr:c-type cytochrome [Opitutaceae bacterium]